MKYDNEMIKKVTLFEKVTGAQARDAFYFKERLAFIVEPGDMGKALGKNKKNVYKLQDLMNEKLKIAEYDPSVTKFIVNFLNPLQIKDIEETDGVVTIRGGDERTNGIIIGRKASNLRKLEEVVGHYFDIEEIKVK